MRKLLKFELRKLRKSKSFWVCNIVIAGMILLNIVSAKSVMSDNGLVERYTTYEALKNFVSYGMLSMMMAIFTAIFVCEDFAGGTIKNIFSRGYKRTDVYISKYIVTTIASLNFCMVSIISILIFGNMLLEGNVQVDRKCIESILTQLVILISYNTLFFVISVLSGQVGMSVAFNIMGPSLIGLGLALVDSFLKLEKFKLGDYWLEKLLVNMQSNTFDSKTVGMSLCISIVFALAVSFVGVKRCKKIEI